MMKADALSVETVDSKVLNLAKSDIVWYQVKDLIKEVPGKDLQGINIVEFSGDDEEHQNELVESLCRRLDQQMERGEAGVIGYQTCKDLPSILSVYAMRKKSVGLLGKAPGDAKPIPFTEDTAVPPSTSPTTSWSFARCLTHITSSTACSATLTAAFCT